MIEETPIMGVKDVFDILRKLGTARILFRGQDVDDPLIPRFARLVLGMARPDKLENTLYERFKKESRAYLPTGFGPESPILDWLSVAQHYGLPTRLLDWSSNALVALWFAVRPARPLSALTGDGTKRVLWVFELDDADILDPVSHNLHFETFSRNYVFQPFHIDRRISAQGAWFSIHRFREPNEYVALSNGVEVGGKLTKYWIHGPNAFSIKRELFSIGITPAALFPDLNGLCEGLELDFLIDRPLRPANLRG